MACGGFDDDVAALLTIVVHTDFAIRGRLNIVPGRGQHDVDDLAKQIIVIDQQNAATAHITLRASSSATHKRRRSRELRRRIIAARLRTPATIVKIRRDRCLALNTRSLIRAWSGGVRPNP
jgi:hypothetical protein